ncbi:helix-turn-helix transcriptional regulator, partial [Streptomyces violascens]|uniref:helix-turn-helix transcriptional regulator n=1 Tax=Streptomyces violascens TaxID=67381 RepID=UPI0036804B47
MSPEQEELFASVDALLEQVTADDGLPQPAERRRLRKAAGLSQEQVARALDVRRESVTSWEAGRSEPRPPKRAAYLRLLEGLAARHPEPPGAPELSESPASTAPATAAPASTAPAAPARVAPPPAPPAAVRPAARGPEAAVPMGAARRPSPKKAAARPPAPAAHDPRFADGPLVVLDGDANAYCVGGLILDCPAKDIVSLVEWALDEARLGAERLHRSGKDADPLVVLTAAAAERLGLPALLEDRRGLRLAEDHPAVRQITRAKWKLTRRGFGPWARVYRPAQSGQRRCVQFAVLPWGALDARAWGSAGQLPPAELARVLGAYATRVITPRGSTAVSGLELMTALRPPTRAVKDQHSGAWVSGPMPGSLTEPVEAAPPQAPDGHPRAPAHHPP